MCKNKLPGQQILIQESKEKDILSIFSSGEIQAFTENDIFKSIGLQKTTLKEMRELIKPEHLLFIGKMFGIKEELNDDNHMNNNSLSYG